MTSQTHAPPNFSELWTTGYIASHVTDFLLSQGFGVRGTARSLVKLSPFERIWEEKYGKEEFEGFVVEDM